MDVLLQMVLAGKGVGLFFDIEIASQMRAGRVLPCGPAFDPVARVMLIGARARTPEAAPLLALPARMRCAARTKLLRRNTPSWADRGCW